MDEQELLKLIARDEGQHIEFKLESEPPTSLARVMQGFLHAEGGFLFIGITDNGKISGVKRPKIILDHLNRAANMLTPSILAHITPEVVEINGKAVVVVYVPEINNKAFMLSGSYHKRVGSYTVDMVPDELMQRFIRSGQLSAEKLAVPYATIEDINEKLFISYMQRRVKNFDPARADLKDLLRRDNFLTFEGDVERPTVAAILLFGKNPGDFGLLRGACIKAARFLGLNLAEFIDEQTLEGPISAIIDQAILFFHRNIRHPLIIDPKHTGSYEAVRTDEYPEDTIREAILNALCHRDYYDNRAVYLKIFDDRIEIESPGGLYNFKTIDEARGHHRTRNPVISDTLYIMGLIEKFGSGIDRMEKAMQASGLQPPLFSCTPDRIVVTLYGHETPAILREKSVELVRNSYINRVNQNGSNQKELILEEVIAWLVEVSGSGSTQRRARQAQLILYLRSRSPVITATEYADLVGLEIKTARMDLAELVSVGVIERFGENRHSTYQLPVAQIVEDENNNRTAEEKEFARLRQAGMTNSSEVLKRLTRALVYLKNNDFITNSQYRLLTSISSKQAGKDLHELVQAGILEASGANSARKYTFANPHFRD